MNSDSAIRSFHAHRAPPAFGGHPGTLVGEGDRSAAFGHRLPCESGQSQDGVWCEWQWDGRRLHIQSSRHGMYPLFFAQRPGEICISNRLTEVLARCSAWVRLDEDAIAAFLRLGFFLDDDTPFDGIKAFPPGSCAQWDGERLQIDTRERDSPATPSVSVRDHMQAYAGLFADAMARRKAQGPVLLPLSGGRDSRHVLFELCRSERPPSRCITAELPPPRSNEDMVVARELCRRFSIPHETVVQGSAHIQAAARKNLLTSYCCDEHTWAMPLVDRINREQATLYDGIGGDVLSAGLFSTEHRVRLARAGRAEELAVDLLGDNEAGWRVALTPKSQDRYAFDRAVATVAASVRPHLDTPNPIASFFFWNRTRREIALYSFGMYRNDSVVFAPFLDHALFDYLMGLPAELLLDKQFHTRTIEAAYPEWSSLRYTLRDDDPAAATWPVARRRLFHARLAWDFGRMLLASSSQEVRVWPLVARLGRLAGHPNADEYWFNIDRIQWLLEVERAAALAGSPAAAHASQQPDPASSNFTH